VLTSTRLFAQQEIPDTMAFSQIRDAELKNSHIPEIAFYLTDVSGPRLTGSPGFKRAADWALSTMKKWGLTNTVLEPWGEFGKNWELKDFSIIMKAPYAQPVLAFPDPWSANTKGVEQAQVILLTSDQLLDTVYISKHLGEFKGKIILAIDNAPAVSKNADQNFRPLATRLTDTELSQLQDTYMALRSDVQQIISYLHDLNRAQLLLKKAGVVALIRSEHDDKNGVVFNTTYTGFKPHSPEIMPKATMAFEDGQKIKRLIESGHPVEIAIQISATVSSEDNNGYNVIAEIPGTDPALKSQVVMLGAHLDSWAGATGATDNVAGCAVMMEAVRLLDSLGLKPKRTIRIALWGGEEEGVYGPIIM
jgi:carboxypeptidase Q